MRAKYRIISGTTLVDLADFVDREMSLGWFPIGGPFVDSWVVLTGGTSGGQHSSFSQAIIRKEELPAVNAFA